MFEKCANCSTRVVMGKKDPNGIFCSSVCQNFYRYPGFCKNCSTSTSDVSAGGTFTMNGVGTKIYGGKDPCPECASTIQTKWFVILFIPVIPIGKYRTKWCTPGRYISRKVIKNKARQEVSGSATFTSTMGR
jgi:endogenous inhibitor of DNA gyrase (YacG/DUF329 family)